MSECTHDCSSCSENCAQRDPASFRVQLNDASHIKLIVGVLSGKGGVGKSLVTSLVAAKLA